MNLPTYLTMSRILCVPILLWILLSGLFSSVHGAKELAASAVFILASLTDGVDGYLARRRGQITTLGMLLDPLADKLLVSAAFIALVQLDPKVVPSWVAVLIIGREFLVSGLRSIASSEGFTIEASDLGKFKTVVQIVTVVACVLGLRWDRWEFGYLVIPVHMVAVMGVWFTVAVSVISAVDYFYGFWSKVEKTAKVRRRRRAFVLSRKGKKPEQVTT
ncbi:MAG: CDP-diacylglycerol--glycerol-3-phosphate 3-phosphatidyltransferase [Acidobacteriaceae bacterium]